NIKLIVEFSENAATVLANPDRLKQVLLNLLENAIRYTPRGGKVGVSAGLSNGFLRVNVTDSGQGIPAGEQDLIWEKFYKVDKSRARADGAGTGLGLAIARRLVEKMGGGISVESSPGKGTTFSFTVRTKQ
ncbi:MAG: sensor histidine kinase, partial [Desulfocucumaceae bacterium]